MSNENKINADVQLLNELLGVNARKPGKAASLPAAIRVIETLEPVGGKDIPVFPASYAGTNDQSPPVYDLSGIEYDEGEDTVRIKNGTGQIARIKRARLCALDSPQSQANRMEPAFAKDDDLKKIVPQATATIPRSQGNLPEESIFLLPHRVADFRIRLSEQGESVRNAISAFAENNALPLLQKFPTSLLFGFWNSRGEGDVGVKHARILLSRIDAHNVIPCRRHSLYSGPYSKDEFCEIILDSAEIDAKKLSAEGFTNAPSDGLGGVLVEGTIERISILSLSDIARINCFQEKKQDSEEVILDPDKTNAARRYLFAIGALAEGYQRSCGSYPLRSGCELVGASEIMIEFRGAQPSNAASLIALYNDRDRLIGIARDAMKILNINESANENYIVTKDTLKGKVVSAKDIQKAAEKAMADATKDAEKAEIAAKKAEEKAAKPNAKDKDRQNAEAKRKEANELALKVKELTEKKTPPSLPETQAVSEPTPPTQ